MFELLLHYPALPLGSLVILAAFLLLSRGLRKAEQDDHETMDALCADMEQTNVRLTALEKKATDHGDKITKLALRGVK